MKSQEPGKSLRRRRLRCPGCRKPMKHWIVRSTGLVACWPRYLTAMRRLQRAAEAGRSTTEDGGSGDGILPMWPFRRQKYAHCHFCTKCRVVTIAAADAIPQDRIPKIAR